MQALRWRYICLVMINNFKMAVMLRFFLILASLTSFSFSAFAISFKAEKRNHIQVVGSSTVYPFTSTIAEEFGRNSKFKTPIIEATGTGGGFKLFCSGVGYSFPDFSNASRKIEASEIKKCAENGVKDVVEIKIGYDGIVLANSTTGRKFSLTKKQIFLALAAQVVEKNSSKLVNNYYQKWSDIDESLPKIDIAIYGPPTTSGTRDAFVELVMEHVCVSAKEFIDVYPDPKIRKKKCHVIRSDGKFIEAGENDNLIVQKLKNDPDALGIFGFSFLEENRDTIQSATINQTVPSFENIVSGDYPVSRPLFIYFKKEHLNLIDGMRQFVAEIISKDTIGNDGYLLQKGLIPLTDFELKKVQGEVAASLN
jgi:phosphate transport system substrate-binding protein